MTWGRSKQQHVKPRISELGAPRIDNAGFITVRRLRHVSPARAQLPL